MSDEEVQKISGVSQDARIHESQKAVSCAFAIQVFDKRFGCIRSFLIVVAVRGFILEPTPYLTS